MKSRIARAPLALALAPLLVACTIDESLDTLEFRTTFGCSNCGNNSSNSAHANLYPISTLSLLGAANDDGIRVVGIKSPGGLSYRLRTVGDDLAAFNPVTNTVVAQGAGLIGWDIHVVDGEGGHEEIRVFGYDPYIPSWASGAAPISGYALAYEDPNQPGEYLSVCPESLSDPGEIAVTVIRGEIYDEATKEAIPAPDWITIACFGNAVAKMKLMNYGPQSDFGGGAPATLDQRQATLRMITADYCGDGTSFTADGTLLDWKNSAATLVPAGAPAFDDVEAVWTKSGALCLGTPRLAERWEVDAYCTIPKCEESDLDLPHEWITWKKP